MFNDFQNIFVVSSLFNYFLFFRFSKFLKVTEFRVIYYFIPINNELRIIIEPWFIEYSQRCAILYDTIDRKSSLRIYRFNEKKILQFFALPLFEYCMICFFLSLCMH